MSLEFDPLTGEPAAWNLPEPAAVTWYREATAYAVMKWPSLDALDRPDPRELRTVLYQHAFNPARPAEPGGAAAQILGWTQQASLSIGCLSEPAVLRTALEALTLPLDGSRAAANTIIRKRAALHGALGYAAESGLLPDNSLGSFGWQVPQSSAALDPAVVPSPPRSAHCWMRLPGSGWGMLRLAAATPRTAAAWTSSATNHEQRGLKHRPDGAIRMVPVPRCWSPCSVPTSRPTAPHPTAGCSGEPAAGRSADRPTAVPGTPPALSPSAPS
jgi:hypothetical protein